MKKHIIVFSVACCAAALLICAAFALFPDVNDTSCPNDSGIPAVNDVSSLQQESSVSSIDEISDENSTADESDALLPERFTAVWITDTQYYSKYYPATQTAMVDWICEWALDGNAQLAFHTGDIVHNYDAVEQWEAAKAEYSKLNGKIKYILLAGNHDVGFSAVDYSQYFKYIGDGEKVVPEGEGGIFDNGKAQYILFSSQTHDYIFLGFCWNTSTAMLEWANALLEQYSDRTAIFMTHSYLEIDSTLTSNGERLFNELISTSPNIRLVLCGHNHGAAQVASEIDDNGDGITDRTVYQILADYQAEQKGGQGYLRLLTFDEIEKKLLIRTYSPLLDDDDYYEDG
ncbi:MAG TPA: metallophosphoesterase, partial [Bacillota bacterium]|nr:metallophosphoesterase [Bacillota bacterium]